MNWILIDSEKCNGCKFCVVRCPRCFSKVGDKIIGRADDTNCNICGHCISLCEPGAITHEQMDMSNFPAASPDDNFDTETFINFIRNRRSHRHFKNKGIPRKDLETLVDVSRYAPTGGNAQTVEVIVVEDREKITKLSNQTVDTFVTLSDQAGKEIERLKANGKEIPEMLVRTQMYGELMLKYREEGKDPIFHNSKAIMIFHTNVQGGASKDNSVIASTTVSLVARTMGIESTFIGFFVAASISSEAIKKELELPEHNEIQSVLMMGYPRLKFHTAVDRFPAKVTWF